MKKIPLFTFAIILLLLEITSCKKHKIKGCTSPTAFNYNPSAEEDDYSCEFTPPLPTSWSVNFNIVNGSGNYESAYVDIFLKKQDGSTATIEFNEICARGQYSKSGTYEDLLNLGYTAGDSMKIIIEDCNWLYYESKTRLIPTSGSGNESIYFYAFVLD